MLFALGGDSPAGVEELQPRAAAIIIAPSFITKPCFIAESFIGESCGQAITARKGCAIALKDVAIAPASASVCLALPAVEPRAIAPKVPVVRLDRAAVDGHVSAILRCEDIGRDVARRSVLPLKAGMAAIW